MQTGHEEIDGKTQEVFEFRHLTFQEYLAALGLVEEHYPGRENGIDLLGMLKSHFADANWREVIPLAAVLADRKDAECLIAELASICESSNPDHSPHLSESDHHANLIRHCLLDEVQVRPGTLKSALAQSVRLVGRNSAERSELVRLARGKFGGIFQQVVKKIFFEQGQYWDQYSRAIEVLVSERLFSGQRGPDEYMPEIDSALKSNERVEQGFAVIGMMKIYFDLFQLSRDDKWKAVVAKFPTVEQLEAMYDKISMLLSQDDLPLGLCVSWCLSWAGEAVPSSKPNEKIIRSLFDLWKKSEYGELSRFAGWALSTQPLLPRDTFEADDWNGAELVFQENKDDTSYETIYLPFVIAWYRGSNWNDDQLLAKIREQLIDQTTHQLGSSLTLFRILDSLGEKGRSILNEIASKRKKGARHLCRETRNILRLQDATVDDAE